MKQREKERAMYEWRGSMESFTSRTIRSGRNEQEGFDALSTAEQLPCEAKGGRFAQMLEFQGYNCGLVALKMKLVQSSHSCLLSYGGRVHGFIDIEFEKLKAKITNFRFQMSQWSNDVE